MIFRKTLWKLHYRGYLNSLSVYVDTMDTIQDFLCKLGMKPHMHLVILVLYDLVDISIFSLNHVITRPTKIIKDVCKAST